MIAVSLFAAATRLYENAADIFANAVSLYENAGALSAVAVFRFAVGTGSHEIGARKWKPDAEL
jgi:hypothetical protein